MTVFVVTEGEYSDYHICAIFATEEEAKAFGGGDIAEWKVGMPPEGPFRPTWFVGIDCDTGNLSDTFTERCNLEQHPPDWSQGHTQFGYRRRPEPRGYAPITTPHGNAPTTTPYGIFLPFQPPPFPPDEPIEIAIGQSVVSRDHAYKVACEARQEWLRKQAQA